jgi:hypothetical protein
MNTDLNLVSALPSIDAEYCFGHPKTYLAPHELARLTLLRSVLGETSAERAAERVIRRRVAAAARTSDTRPS